MAKVEVAQAYVAVTVKATGAAKSIAESLDEVDSEGAGKKIGDGLGSGISNKQAAIAGAVGGIFASIANTVASSFVSLFSDAIAQSDATDKFQQTLEFAGLDTSAIDEAVAASQDYADQTVYDLSTIQNTTAQLAANGVGNYTELTEAAGNLNAVAGGNAETFDSVAMMLSQTAGAGKLTTENWNQLADAIPGASGRLQDALKEAGAYTGNFRDAMENGEITADEFNDAILSLGSEPVAQEAATSVETMEGAVGNLQASITGALADAFDAIKPYLTEFISFLSDAVTWIQDNISWIGALAGGLAIAAAAWGVYTGVMAVVAAYHTAAAAAEGGLTVAQWLLNAAMSANPIGLVVIAIGLLIGVIILLWQNWDSVVAWISDVWAGFISWITEVINAFAEWWDSTWSAVGSFISDIWSGIVSGVTGYVGMVRDAIAVVVDAIKQKWENIWRGIGSFFSNIWDGIVGAVEAFGSTFRGIFDGIKGFVQSAFSGVVGVVKAPINGIISLINSAIGALNSLSVTIPDWVPIVGGQTWGLSLPTIPMLAKGGTITGAGSVIVGENGPELLRLPRGAQVDPNIDGGGQTELSDDAIARLAAALRAGTYEGLSAVRSADSRAAVLAGSRGWR